MKHLPTIALLAAGLLAGCNGKKENGGTSSEPSVPTISAVNYPLTYFAERLTAGFDPAAVINFDAPADEDPAFWKPADAQIAKMQQGHLILLNGAGYAKWTATATLPFEKTVDTSGDFADNYIEVKETVTHAHSEDEEAHSHAGTAFTTWLDLKQAARQAKAIADALTEEFPDEKDTIAKNLSALQSDLQALDDGMRAATAKLKGAPVLASHPIYQYWERAYGLKVPSLPWEPEMELTAEAMADLAKLQSENPGAKYFLWEGDPLPGHIDKLKAAGLTSFVVAPCMNRPESGDFLTVMKANIAAIEAVTN